MPEPEIRVMLPHHGSGPVHLLRAGDTLTWCGSKPQFRHNIRPGSVDEVDCKKCLRAIKNNQPRAWRG